MDVPITVETALEDRPVAGATCLEAGAGVGKTTAGLLAAGAGRVYAVTDDRADARTVRERIGADARRRTAVLEADLREAPLASDSVDVITAHGLFNVLAPADVPAVVAELTRVARPGAHLVVDDYAPPPEEALVRDLFAVENAAAQLAAGRPALSFYPARFLRETLVGAGWSFDRQRTLLDPVPWTANHVAAHAERARSLAADAPERLRDPLLAEIDRIESAVEEERAGQMYSLAVRLPE
ncbi:MAG: class I SAM-dependent methyltransferase [Haloarculaceae archaeon]